MPELPTGTVTFLFTDIEGSTRLLSELGPERYGDVLVEHRGLMRRALVAHGGHEFGTEGDASFVAFATASGALAAAASMQHALAAHGWPEGSEVRVRMGIHTGEAVVTRNDYVGLAVHQTARIAAAAHGAQVLVSQTTRELACG
ncbi:MAG: adenylate/guanylate cyclase domain-containing protein, partial [Actinomycetota bacterium]|nr:adenylate/guanylate cyclase domain-containing protein [Actinomycetota bacterium]